MNESTTQSKNSLIAEILKSREFISLLLFTLAFVPRLLDLGRFLTADEFLWVDRSRNFVAGLTNNAYQCLTVVEKWEVAHGLACTLRTGHPGVTTMWTGSFGLVLTWLANPQRLPLHDYVLNVSTNPLDASLIAPARFGTVLLVSVWVVAVYWLARRLFGTKIALVGTLFIALDPFHIALSRVIHHDALSTTFMTLSALTMLVYWGQKAERKWLIASGILAGFGFLSKSPALFLMPFVAIVGLWFTIKDVKSGEYETDKSKTCAERCSKSASQSIQNLKSKMKITILDGLLWFVVAVAIVFIFWPAMWVIPLEAIEAVFFIGSKYATGGHAKGNFFLGTISPDPGPLFYPVSWLFRASPLVLIGVITLPIAWLLRRPTAAHNNSALVKQNVITPLSNKASSFTRFLPLILIFILGYYLLMSLGAKKQERYFLPVYPWLNLLAAAGLVLITHYLWTRVTHRASHVTMYLVVTLILLVNGFLVALHYPYYFTYYNPLLGGPQRAVNVLTIGWGEGLDQVADYLNHQINPNKTKVATWYQSTFAPFYYGPAISYSKEKGRALAGDYVVFYINQVQRRFPDDTLFDYIKHRYKPNQIFTLHGVEYAWVYPSLGVDHYVEDQTYTGIASLLAWQWGIGDVPLIPGQATNFELYWEYLGKELDEPFFFRLVDAQNRVWTEGESQLIAAYNPPVETWRQGEILYETGQLYIPPGMPPGQYQLQIGFLTKASAVTKGELLFMLPPAEATINIGHAPLKSYPLLSNVTTLNQPLTDSLTLWGATWPQKPLTSATNISLDLYWVVKQPLIADANLHLALTDQTGEVKQAWFNLSLAETINPANTTWQSGDFIRTRWQLDLLPEVPPGKYYFELVLPDDTNVTLSFGEVTVR